MPADLPNDRERFAPITLPGKKPVAQLVINRAFTLASFLQPCRDLLFRFCGLQSIDDRRIHGNAVADKSKGWLITERLDDFDNRQIEFLREFQIAFVMSRHTPDRDLEFAKKFDLPIIE